MRFRGTLAARVALLVTVAVGLSVAVVAAAGYLTVRHELLAAPRRLAATSGPTRPRADGGRRRPPGPEVPAWVLGAADVQIAVRHAPTADVAYIEAGARASPIELGRDASSPSPRGLIAAARPHGRHRRTALPRRRRAGPRRPGTALILAQSLEPTHDALEQARLRARALRARSASSAAGFAGWAVARNGLRPVRRLTAAVEEIARTEKLDPITVEGNDEVARLATAFNPMLAALAASRDRQRQLVADAGHELRTPLTSLRTNLELLTPGRRPRRALARSRARS